MNPAFHPLAEIFPLIEGADFDALVADIKTHGLHEAIVTYQGAILDGRNRYRACLEAGIEPRFESYTGDDPVSYVVSLNLKRRHLNESQRAMVAARLATLKRGDNQHSPIGETSQAKAAELLNVGKRSVERAKEVRDQGATELISAVERGQVSVTAAADVSSIPIEEQQEIVARGPEEILEAAKAIRAQRVEAKRAEKVAETLKIAERNTALPISRRKYSVIYADPPWQFECWNGNTGAANRSLAQGVTPYPTLSIEQLQALPVEKLAADDCALFLWAVMPELPGAFEVIKAWGFEYKTVGFTWVKQNRGGTGLFFGMGYWTRANAELCLLATRGSPPRLNADVHQIIMSPVGEHSTKPHEVAERIERLVPGPYIELFARHARSGWDAWGNEAPSKESWDEMWTKPFHRPEAV